MTQTAGRSLRSWLPSSAEWPETPSGTWSSRCVHFKATAHHSYSYFGNLRKTKRFVTSPACCSGGRPHEASQPQRQQVLPESSGRGGPGRSDGRRGVSGAAGVHRGSCVVLDQASRRLQQSKETPQANKRRLEPVSRRESTDLDILVMTYRNPISSQTSSSLVKICPTRRPLYELKVVNNFQYTDDFPPLMVHLHHFHPSVCGLYSGSLCTRAPGPKLHYSEPHKQTAHALLKCLRRLLGECRCGCLLCNMQRVPPARGFASNAPLPL